MKQDFFKFLPAEIISNIFLKLSVRSVAVSKCVCKPWLHLLESDDFIASHFAQSAPALALMKRGSNWLKLFELEEEELDLDLSSLDPLTRFGFPCNASIGGSANGLLFLYSFDSIWRFYICNPITAEFIELFRDGIVGAYGFGVSRISGQHKVVSIPIFVDEVHRFDCQVYTLGTGLWRLVEATDSVFCHLQLDGEFVHGNLHWMVLDDGIEWISCFDLETERFSRFTVPPLEKNYRDRKLYALRDSLGCFDESSEGEGIVVWMMKEYGVEKSWTKEYVIDLGLGDPVCQRYHPIKVYENGDLLYQKAFWYYSKKGKSSREIGGPVGVVMGEFDYMGMRITSHLHTPSMLSLKKCFGSVEKVVSF